MISQTNIYRLLFFLLLIKGVYTYGQTPLYSGVLVSDMGTNNNIGNANSSRNIDVSNDGIIYVSYTGTSGIRVSKSTNRGQSFLPSIMVTTTNAEPEIVVNDAGIIFVTWSEGGNILLSISTDQGNSFSGPRIVGAGSFSVHMTVFNNYIYLVDKTGEYVYSNSNNGMGVFNNTQFTRHVFADIWTDLNGNVYVPSDNPSLFLLESLDFGQNFSSVGVNPSRNIFFSSYALSDGPCGTYIFVGGGGLNSIIGYKIDVSNGSNVPIILGDNFSFQGRTLYGDNRGTLIDGYQNSAGELVMNVSSDQGQTFGAPITIATGGSHNITRNPITEDVVVVYEQNGQIYVSVYDNLLKIIKIDESQGPFEVCLNESLTVPFILSNGFAPDTELTFYLSDAMGNFENKTLIGSVVTNSSGSLEVTLPVGTLPGDQYRILIESLADCTQSNSASLIIHDVPPVISLSGPFLLCVDLNGSETVNTPPIIDTYLSATEYDFTWFIDATEQTQFTNLSSIVPLKGGNYFVEARHKTTGCSSISDLILVYESSPPTLTARVTTEAFANKHIIEVEANSTASNNSISEYEFSLNNGEWFLGNGSTGGRYTFTFDTNVRLGENTVRVRDINGCGESEVRVIVMDYPLFFTPNGDSFNNTWNITAPQLPKNYLAQVRIFIYDRYGKLLKQLNPLGPGWDGTYNGNLMPTNDYWFMVQFIDPLDDSLKQFGAHFTLKR
jgi:gliding motility-associated-like protein